MRSSLRVRWNCATKAEKVYSFVCIIKLQNAANLLDHLKVLVFSHVKVVQRLRVLWSAVAQSEVNGNVQIDSAATKYIL